MCISERKASSAEDAMGHTDMYNRGRREKGDLSSLLHCSELAQGLHVGGSREGADLEPFSWMISAALKKAHMYVCVQKMSGLVLLFISLGI